MLKTLARTLRVTAVSASLLVVSSLVSANSDLDETVDLSGFSGSFLASRVAITDQDDEAAVRFLEKAVSFDTESQDLKRDLLGALVSNGRIEEAGKIAREIDAQVTFAGILLRISDGNAVGFRYPAAHQIALRRLDLQHLGAIVAQGSGACRAGDDAGEIENGDAFQYHMSGPGVLKRNSQKAGILSDIAGARRRG